MRLVVFALTLGLLATSSSQASAQRPTRSADERLAETLARRSLAELGARPPEAERLLERNLSRYFVAFPLLAGAENRQAVLQGTLRGTARFAGGVLLLAVRSRDSQSAGSGAVHLTEDDVTAALDRVLPRRANEWNESVFFPDGAAVPIEAWDLRAMEATGTPWAALGFLVQQPIPQRLADATISDAAADHLADAAGAFAVLALRLAGEDARAKRDSYVQPRHLRAAIAKIQELRQATGPVPLWAPGSEDGTAGSIFTDVTAASGVDFRHLSSDWIARFRRWGEDAPTFSGGGVAARDLTGDGRADLVFCGGGGCRLYRNVSGTSSGIAFEDVTIASGLEASSDGFEARMPLPADLDGDGDLDLFVTAARDGNRLYRNDSGEAPTFVDVTAASGLSRPGDVSGPAAAFDADGDGNLDLFVGNFGDYLSGASPWLSPDSRNGQPNRLFLNQGELRFKEATDAGVADTGWAQAVSHFDFDGDGDQDVYVANDFGRNELLRNEFSRWGDGTFESAGALTGGDDPFHGMNAAFADLDRDRLPDVFITNIWTWNPADGSLGETNSLLLSQDKGDDAAIPVVYKNVSAASGLDGRRHRLGMGRALLRCRPRRPRRPAGAVGSARLQHLFPVASRGRVVGGPDRQAGADHPPARAQRLLPRTRHGGRHAAFRGRAGQRRRAAGRQLPWPGAGGLRWRRRSRCRTVELSRPRARLAE